MDHIRLVFDRLLAAGSPNASQREVIYQSCRDQVRAALTDPKQQQQQLEALEKVIRRQEMQAIYEETLGKP